MAKWIVFFVALIFLLIISLARPISVSSAPALDSIPAAVKIVCTQQRTNGSAVDDVTLESLGNFIAPNFILTHNHFGFTLGRQSCHTLIITDKAGHSWRWRAIDAQLIAIDSGTGLIWLPNKLLAPIAPLTDSTSLPDLPVGSWLTVNYWDDNTKRIAQHDFQLVQIKDGIARLADPDRVINSGDSGGGAYFTGRLVGNTWSINLDSARRPMGSFNVALLPSQVRGYVQ
jgi:hypothetical protein